MACGTLLSAGEGAQLSGRVLCARCAPAFAAYLARCADAERAEPALSESAPSYPPRPRFYVKTTYHVWTICRRHDDNLDGNRRPNSDLDAHIESIGARGRGDRAARALARERCDALNAREQGAQA